ncbi:hypothetical protein HWV62_1731 [Athelia sp. TMB]|nr:hypothetical protein HWV62_1731 [Athelia sp. TMB]
MPSTGSSRAGRCCNTLLGMIEKEAEVQQQQEVKAKGVARGKKRGIDDVKEKESPTPSTSAVAPAARKSHKKKKV